jgi:tRNA 2-selenouridine synthase
MPAPIKKTSDWHGAYDAIIDVRSPSEYADDHIPGAINLPVLSDEERAEVGTIYKQSSPFAARKIGAALISRNIANHLDQQLGQYPSNWSPLIYCWRGGQRSGAMARIFSEIGWPVHILDGGYKTYRRIIKTTLTALANQLYPIMLDGATGVGKTLIISALAKNNVQSIDLEALAVHRGSVLGAFPDQKQPSQRLFESKLYDALMQLDVRRPVIIEAESSKVGQIHIPDGLWKKMLSAQSITVTADIAARVNYILRDYHHIISDPSILSKLVHGMVRRHGHAITSEWSAMIEKENWKELVTHLIENHYDPAYQSSARRRQRVSLGLIHMETLTDIHINQAAIVIADKIKAIKVTKK